MNTEALLVILVSLSAVAVVIQAVSMWQASRTMSQLMQRLDEQSQQLEQDVRGLISRIEGLVERMEPLGTMAENVKASVDLVSRIVQDRAADVDQFVREMVELGREQAVKIDHAVTDTVQKFEQTTDVIQQDVVRPAVEISSFFKGIRAGISFLFNRKAASRPDEIHPEEELFI